MAKTNNTQRTYLNIKGMKVQNVRRLGKVLAFTLTGNGLGLYNMRLVNGKNGYFVAPPQVKGNDNNWYNQYAVYLEAEDEEKIIKRVLELVPAEEGTEEL